MAPPHKLFLAAIFTAVVVTVATGHGNNNAAKDNIIHSSCLHASYPSLCVRTLSTYSGPTITNRRELAQAAVKISLSNAKRAVRKLTAVRDSVVEWKKKREKAAVVDCVEMIGDSVDELSRTLGVLKHLHVSAKEFRWQMSNAQTWASAALTDDDTCLDGFQGIDGDVKTEVKKLMTKVARVTSNALYMINQLDGERGKPHFVHP